MSSHRAISPCISPCHLAVQSRHVGSARAASNLRLHLSRRARRRSRPLSPTPPPTGCPRRSLPRGRTSSSGREQAGRRRPAVGRTMTSRGCVITSSRHHTVGGTMPSRASEAPLVAPLVPAPTRRAVCRLDPRTHPRQVRAVSHYPSSPSGLSHRPQPSSSPALRLAPHPLCPHQPTPPTPTHPNPL